MKRLLALLCLLAAPAAASTDDARRVIGPPSPAPR
jgi:hypothetical protein